MDFTIIPESIKTTLESGGHPLTDDQYMLMAGALGGIQQMIAQIGLEDTIEVLEPLANNDKQG